jgi:hypothetical protein
MRKSEMMSILNNMKDDDELFVIWYGKDDCELFDEEKDQMIIVDDLVWGDALNTVYKAAELTNSPWIDPIKEMLDECVLEAYEYSKNK